MTAVFRWAAVLPLVAAVLGGGQAAAADARDPRSDPGAALAVSRAAVGHPLGEYVFTNDLNRRVELADLRGKPLVVSLVYTSCADICPIVSESLARAVDVANDLVGKESFNVVTLGFDARNDTPQRMRAFARSHGIERPNWQFLSADAESIDRLAAEWASCSLPRRAASIICRKRRSSTRTVESTAKSTAPTSPRRSSSSRSRTWCSGAVVHPAAGPVWSARDGCSAVLRSGERPLPLRLLGFPDRDSRRPESRCQATLGTDPLATIRTGPRL